MNKLSARPYIILFALWIIVQIILYYKVGVHVELEAEKYISQAKNLLVYGHYSAPKYLFYSTLILIISFFLKLKCGYISVVLFQIFLNGLATYLFYTFALKTTDTITIAYASTVLLIIFYPLQIWNVYLYTESIFISLVICFVYLLHKYPPNTVSNIFINVIGLTLLIFTRPFGMLFIPPFFLYAIFSSKGFLKYLLLILSILGLLIFVFLLNYAFKGGEDMDALKPFREEHIICFMPSPNPAKLDLKYNGNPVYEIFYYITHNPLHFLGLMIKRLFSFFNLYRQYYSNTHNLYLLFVILPSYAFAFIGFVNRRKLISHQITLFLLLLILLYALGTTFQCDDYHSRFIMPLFPFIFLFSSAGLYYIFNILKSKVPLR